MAIDKLQTDALSNTVTATVASFAIGANVSINSSAVFFGNSTINTVMTASSLTIANVSLNSSTIVIGSGKIAAGGVTLPSNFGVSSNTTNLLENRGGQLFFNGRRVDLVNEYAAVYGYAMGGYTGGGTPVTTVDRIAFSTSTTTASTASNLATARYNVGGTSDCSVYGYTFGGANGIAYLATGDRTAFSTSVTAASTISNLSSARSNPTGVSDGAIYGYAMGGYDPSSTTVDRITFRTSITAASTVSNLSTARGHAAGISDGSVYGYVTGGVTTALTSSTNRITFSTSATAAATGTTLSDARYTLTGLSDGAVYGYVLGGYNATTIVTTADRLTFTTGVSAASTVSNLSVARYSMPNQSVSDGTLYGYVFGGVNTSSLVVATTDRLIFSTSVTSAYTAANISQARAAMAGLSDGAV